MDLHITVRGHDNKDELRAYAEERLTSALTRFDERVGVVSVALEDVAANRNGGDKRCRIDLRMRPTGELVIEEFGDEMHATIATAVDRLRAVMSREVGKTKRGVGGG